MRGSAELQCDSKAHPPAVLFAAWEAKAKELFTPTGPRHPPPSIRKATAGQAMSHPVLKPASAATSPNLTQLSPQTKLPILPFASV